MTGARLLLHQFRFDQKVFWRNPAAVFFTVMLPLIFLFIFNLLFGNDEIEGLGVNTSTYYVPAIITLAVISATTQSLAINLTQDREGGLLKRTRGTPLPTPVFVAGRVGNSLVVCVLMVVLVAVLLVWVIPQFKSFYEGLGAELPLVTRLLLGLAGRVSAVPLEVEITERDDAGGR